MADAGLGSRRHLETRISDGEIKVNHNVASTGQKVAVGDHIQIDGATYEVMAEPLKARTLVYNKPEGELTTRNDPEGRPTVFDRLPKLQQGRWIAIGRLDINTAGLLLLTTDGELAHAMMHPSNEVDREYVCRVWGDVSEEQLQQLRDGVVLDDGPARFSDLQPAPEYGSEQGRNHWFYVVLMEGRNREVRRLWEAIGLQVSRLKRVRYGAVQLTAKDRVRNYRPLSPRDHQILREDVGLPRRATRLSLACIDKGRHQPAQRPRRPPAAPADARKTSPRKKTQSRRTKSKREPQRRFKAKP